MTQRILVVASWYPHEHSSVSGICIEAIDS